MRRSDRIYLQHEGYGMKPEGWLAIVGVLFGLLGLIGLLFPVKVAFLLAPAEFEDITVDQINNLVAVARIASMAELFLILGVVCGVVSVIASALRGGREGKQHVERIVEKRVIEKHVEPERWLPWKPEDDEL